MDIIKQTLSSLVKNNTDKDTTSTETAETLVLSEMKDIKIESITYMHQIGDSKESNVNYTYRIYIKSEDGCVHRSYIDESLFNLLLNAYEWMEIDRNEHTETDPDSGYVSKEINSKMIAVTHNTNKD